MTPAVWEIIFLSIIVIPTLVLLTNIMSGEIEIKRKKMGIAFICAFALIYGIISPILQGMIRQIAWGTVLTIFFTIASISVSVLCIIKKRLGLHVDVGDLGAAVGKLHGIETALCRLDLIPFAEQFRLWLKSVGDLQRRAQEIKVGYDRCGLNYSKRLHLSQEARKELNLANDLLRQGNNLLYPQDQLRGTMNFYMMVVIGFIKAMHEGTGLLGIWGMGGVGKTSLLKLLVADSRSEYDNGSFQVLFVRAGTGCTVGQVQEAIAASMGLSLERNETTQARIIHDHLRDTSFILLLDDLWGYLDLKAVGIPSPIGTVPDHRKGRVVGNRQRKVVFTSRNMDLCQKMGCSHDNSIQMKCLDEVDAWNLFDRGWPVHRADVIEKLLPAQTSTSSGQRGRQPHTVDDDQPQRLQEISMSSYEKMCYFIEDEGAESLLLGIWGMRGVGKTTLLRLLRDSYSSKACFDHILLVGAGTGGMVNNVQHAIAISLGLDLAMMSSLDELSRAEVIFNYLEHKNFLLLLDDIREPFNWWAIGMPLLLHRQQKIILATRSKAACALMGCQKVNIIEMKCLVEDDAIILFRDKVGHGIIDDHPQLNHLAQQMVSQCGGLPLALSALGRAMSNKRDPREWRSAYGQLANMRLDPCEIDEKVGTILLNPSYRWTKDTLHGTDPSQDYTVHGQKQSTLVRPGIKPNTRTVTCSGDGLENLKLAPVPRAYSLESSVSNSPNWSSLAHQYSSPSYASLHNSEHFNQFSFGRSYSSQQIAGGHTTTDPPPPYPITSTLASNISARTRRSIVATRRSLLP